MKYMSPLIIAVAPNGARKTKKDHPALPIGPEDLAAEAEASLAAGAAMIHLHVRADDDSHSLDVGRYQAAIAAIRDRVGQRIIIQATSESVGIYTADEQMTMVRQLRPEAVSLAIREIIPPGGEDTARAFLSDLREMKTSPQFILYDDADLKRYYDLRDRGIIPGAGHFLLFVLGRYAKGQTSSPLDMIPFLGAHRMDTPWAVCAFGPQEHRVATAAVALGGHMRVGFENNMCLKNGDIADNNAQLVAQVSDAAKLILRPVADAATAREILGMA